MKKQEFEVVLTWRTPSKRCAYRQHHATWQGEAWHEGDALQQALVTQYPTNFSSLTAEVQVVSSDA